MTPVVTVPADDTAPTDALAPPPAAPASRASVEVGGAPPVATAPNSGPTGGS